MFRILSVFLLTAATATGSTAFTGMWHGEIDVQVDAELNLEALRKNVKNVEVRKMDGLNYLMQHAATGEVTEYVEIKETISPEILSIIAEFIIRQQKPKGNQ